MKLDYLYKYTPAEILLLRDGYDSKIADLLKFTLIDLMYKKVIHYELVQHFEVKTKFFHTFSFGEQSNEYESIKHEKKFLLAFGKHQRLLLHEFIRDYFKQFSSVKEIKNQVIESRLKNFFDQNFIDGIFNRYKRNEEANSLYIQIKKEIVEVETTITSNNISNEECLNLLLSLHGNILFVDKNKCPIINDIEKEIQQQLNKQNNSDFDFFDFDFNFGYLDNVFTSIDFDGFGGGDFGGGGADGVWDLLDIDVS